MAKVLQRDEKIESLKAKIFEKKTEGAGLESENQYRASELDKLDHMVDDRDSEIRFLRSSVDYLKGEVAEKNKQLEENELELIDLREGYSVWPL